MGPPPPCPQVPVAALPLPALGARLEAGEPVRIVALGSSSTAGAGASALGATYPARLEAALRAALPESEIMVLNRGVGGQDAAEMLLRLDWDVLGAAPQLVIWQVGANGAMRRRDPALFRAMIAEGLRRMRAAGAEVILMDNQRAPAVDAAPQRAAFDAALAELAGTEGVSLFSRRRLMEAWAAAGTPVETMLIPDGLHHNDRGYYCVAAALADAILRGIRLKKF